MAADKSYILTVEFDGEYEAECAAYDPATPATAAGAGKALAQLEKDIRTMVHNAKNTYAKVKSLTRQ
jgi:hypothetical protein